MAEVAAGVAWVVEDLVKGAVLVAKGIYDPTLPLNASLRPITAINVPLAYHTIAVVKGRAYLFGGKTIGDDGGVELAQTDMHIVVLPTSDVESADYRKIDATADAPPKRSGHSAAVIDDRIYVFGGQGNDGEPLDENGRVWVYDTVSNKWSHLDPKAGHAPEPRALHASVASEHPRTIPTRPDEGTLPQDPPDPESTIPEIPDADTYGTLIIQGGQGKSGSQLNDMWAFDISTRTWTELPEPPPPSTTSPSLSLVEKRLYCFSSGQTSFLDLTSSSGLAPLSPWQTLPPSSSGPDIAHPGDRTGAAMIPVTTGQGRNYLMLMGGWDSAGEPLEDVWILQLKPEDWSAASWKDAARTAISKDTREAQWEEVKYHDAEGVMIQESQIGRGIGPRKGLAAAKGSEVDGASVLVWGGIGADARPRGDGLMITVDR